MVTTHRPAPDFAAAIALPASAPLAALAAALFFAAAVPDQMAVAAGTDMVPRIADEMPIEDYLGLLRRNAPAAESGARAYLAAHASRCGHPLSTDALRHAVSDGAGDPALMAMIRAAQLKDPAAMQRLAQNLTCQPRSRR